MMMEFGVSTCHFKITKTDANLSFHQLIHLLLKLCNVGLKLCVVLPYYLQSLLVCVALFFSRSHMLLCLLCFFLDSCLECQYIYLLH